MCQWNNVINGIRTITHTWSEISTNRWALPSSTSMHLLPQRKNTQMTFFHLPDSCQTRNIWWNALRFTHSAALFVQLYAVSVSWCRFRNLASVLALRGHQNRTTKEATTIVHSRCRSLHIRADKLDASGEGLTQFFFLFRVNWSWHPILSPFYICGNEFYSWSAQPTVNSIHLCSISKCYVNKW